MFAFLSFLPLSLPVVFLSLLSLTLPTHAIRSWSDASHLANLTTSALTQSEKIGLLTGLGQFHTGCIGDTHAVAPRAGLNATPGIQAGGIPSICMMDGPAGMRLNEGVTGFPTGINAASTFSRRLMRARGEALGEEWRGKGVNMFLGPAMDIMRNPKAGRAWESAGPDAYLTGEFGYETVVGVQSQGVMTSSKHFLANNQEHFRYGYSSNLPDDKTLRELYWYPFLRAIEANTTSVMCTYNRVNGTSSCHNEELLSTLRSTDPEEGFQGWVVSDWGATHDSAADNANAGLDMEQPGDFILIGGGVYGTDGGGLKTAVSTGQVSQARLDEMATNVLRSWFMLEQDDNYPTPNFDTNVHTDAHVSLVREITGASTVLLKNNNATIGNQTSKPTLPLTTTALRKVAIIGQDAAPPNRDCNDLGECNDGVVTVGWGSGTNSLQYTVAPIDALTAFLTDANPNITISSSLSNDIDDARAAAEGADVVFVFANAMSGELGFFDDVVGNLGDRNDLDLWFKGGSLIEAMAAQNKHTIPIIHSVGPINTLSWVNNTNITAILYQGAAGEQVGWGLVDVLFEGNGTGLGGGRNPSGRLPFTLADAQEDYGTEIVYNSITGAPDIDYTERLSLDYKHIAPERVIFPFGFGLSYTTFSYSSLSLTPLPAQYTEATAFRSAAPGVRVSFTVRNTGTRSGTEIAQVYVTYPSSAGEPAGKALRGFEEVGPLAPGESKEVSVDVQGMGMSVWDTQSQSWVRPEGVFGVSVGGNARDAGLEGTI